MNLPLTVFMLHFLQRPLSPLRHNEFVGLDVDTPARHRHRIRIIHGRRARLEDDLPQLGEVLTPIVKIRKTVPAKDSLADPIPSSGQSSAKAGSELAQSPTASLQAAAGEISSARYRSAVSLWIV